MDIHEMRRLFQSAMAKLSAGADFQAEVTLSPEEAEVIVKWIRSEKYRHPRR